MNNSMFSFVIGNLFEVLYNSYGSFLIVFINVFFNGLELRLNMIGDNVLLIIEFLMFLIF